MPIAINGSGTVTGISVGGLPDGIVDADMLASNSVQTAKIADDAVTDAKQNLSGAAKAWINFDGGDVTQVRDSFNVDSVTNVASGKQQINFTNAMPNDDYTFSGSSAQADEDNDNPCFCFPYQYNSQYKTTSVRVKTGYHTNNSNAINVANRSFTSVAIFGD
jgi:hypothetical protein